MGKMNEDVEKEKEGEKRMRRRGVQQGHRSIGSKTS
jgi:hypothetical protein